MAPGRFGPGLSESREAAPDPAGSTQASGPAAAPVRGFGPWRKRGPGSGPRPRSATLPQRPHVTGELGPVPGDSKPPGPGEPSIHGSARPGPASGRARIRELAPGFGLPELLFAAPEGDSFCNSDSIRVLGDSESPGRMRQWGTKRCAPMLPVLPTAFLQAGGALGDRTFCLQLEICTHVFRGEIFGRKYLSRTEICVAAEVGVNGGAPGLCEAGRRAC